METLDCTPFDLLFGQSGPLALLKSAWLHKTDLGTAKQNVEFMLNTREQLRSAVETAAQRTNLVWQVGSYQSFFSRRVVLVLLRISGKPNPCIPNIMVHILYWSSWVG